MAPDPTRHSEDKNAAQQRFLSLFLRSEREIFRYVAALVPNVADAEDIVQQTALAHLDTFSHIGVFSGGSIAVTNITDMAKFKEKVKLAFISYGSKELGTNRVGGARGGFGGDPKENVAALKQAGINAVFYESPNTAHEWLSWRRSLHEIAPLLFKD